MRSKILLINPPQTAIGCRIPKEPLPPLGLLSIGGQLNKAGFSVVLLDAEHGAMNLFDIVYEARKQVPQYVLIGHAGLPSMPATVVILCAMLKTTMPHVTIIDSAIGFGHQSDNVLLQILHWETSQRENAS